MILTIDQIKQEIIDGKIGAISLDTSVFDRYQRNLEGGLLKHMQQFVGSDVKVILTDIVIGELEAHLIRDAEEAQAATRASLKTMVKVWQIPEDKLIEVTTSLFGSDTAGSISTRRLNNYLDKISASVVKSEDHVSVGEVIKRYFDSCPPFAKKESKKHEFPDAFAVLSLESWAQKNNTKVLVVTNDNDWKSYCASSARVIAIDELGLALSCFQHDAAKFNCQFLMDQFISGDPLDIQASIIDAIKEQSSKIKFIPEVSSYFDFEVDGIDSEYDQIKLQKIGEKFEFETVDYGADFLVARIIVEATAELECYFTFEKWDSIDKESMPMGTGSTSTEEEIEIEVLVTFVGALPYKAVISEIEVLPDRHHIFIGEVEPAWMSNDSHYEE